MLICWEWLAQYVKLDIDPEALATRFAMTGLNHESTEKVGNDIVIDLEVTSNRGDCLGHIGVAREASVILGSDLHIPEAAVLGTGQPIAEQLSVVNDFPSGCSRYTARVIRGVKVGPSPEWLVRRLAAIGIASINNVVDATNYVMMECGQPLHAFDLKQVHGNKIIVRAAHAKETLRAIDHRTYELDPQMIVIADAERALAIGGVMGGAESEVSESTTDLLIEAAAFAPLAVRRAARLLKLQSPSSFRFERRPDPAGLDWASRRCCELILQTAGGALCEGVIDVGLPTEPREAIPFRLLQIERVLGIQIAKPEVQRILLALGCTFSQGIVPQDTEKDLTEKLYVVPPSWRADLSREVDLIEEVARIYGYERIPENVAVPLQVAEVRPKDLTQVRVRRVLSAYGIDEAMTASVVAENLEKLGSPWTAQPSLETETPLLVGARLLRRSLLPSLLASRYNNQSQAIRNAQLYEIANLYLPAAAATDLPSHMSALGIVTQGELQFIKGIVEAIIFEVAAKSCSVVWQTCEHSLFAAGSLQQVAVDGKLLGFVGLISRPAQDAMSLDQPVALAELSIDVLTSALQEVRRADRVSLFPAMTRDLNFVVDEPIQWSEFSTVCKSAAGPLLQEVCYQETYRDTKKDGTGKKRLLLSLHFQSLDRTLTSNEVDAEVAKILAACAQRFDAKLLA